MSTPKQQPGRVWSQAPPGTAPGRRRVEIAGRVAPINTSVTRRRHLSGLIASRGMIWAFALLAGGGFLAASMTGDYRLAIGVPVGVALLLLIYAWAKASKLATRDFFMGFAQAHGFTYTERIELLPTTPLLGAGDLRHCEHYMEGPVDDELQGYHAGIAHYVYETVEERYDRRNRAVKVHTPHPFTICVLDLERVITSYPGVFLTARGGLLGGEHPWLDIKHLQHVELESSALANKYKLLARREQDTALLLELFEPSFQVWLGELPFQIYLEFSAGTLVTYVPRLLTDTTSLDIMLQASARIAKRFLKTGEPLRAVPDAARPRYGPNAAPGPNAFPPPPPPAPPPAASPPAPPTAN